MAEHASERYARALLELVLEEKCSKQVQKDLGRMATLIENVYELRVFLFKRLFDGSEKTKVLEEILSHEKMNATTKKFLCFLANKNRFELYFDIVKKFIQKMDLLEDVIDVKVVLAADFSKSGLHEMEQKLEKMIGKKTRISYTVDESILGGMITKVGNQVLDGSLKTQLKCLKEVIYGN